MRLATWNVNSIRSRIDRVEAFVQRHDIDVLALQETKARDDQWPVMGLEALGYEVATLGHNQWNGVAIVSRVGLTDVEHGFEGMPHFGDPHLDYKLAWQEALRRTAGGWLADDPEAQIALTGDWNIAPFDEDVFDISRFATSTHVSPPERAAFAAVVEAGYADLVRPRLPGPGVFTYWDYYRQRFERNRGMRIDFVLGSPALATRSKGALIDTEERAGKGASDHAPVIVELAG
jgi:exodeoxyribonuclease-3